MNATIAATWGDKPVPLAQILKWRPYQNTARTLRGFLTVQLASGLIIHDCKLMVGSRGAFFIGMPAAQRRERDGQPTLDATGKGIWDAVVEFRDRATREKFNETVLSALRLAHPEAFNEGETP